MSVSQVKKRFSEFESFLKNDKEGLRRLKLLKDDVNVLRTSLAAAEAKTAEFEEVKNAARERADEAESELDKIRIEIQALRQQVANLTRDLEEASKLDPELDDDGAMVRLDPEDHRSSVFADKMVEKTMEEFETKRVVKELRKYQKFCPRARLRTRHLDYAASVYDRDSLASGWSRQSLWILGASVALISALNGQVVIKSNQRTQQMRMAGDPEKSACTRHLIQWYATYNAQTDTTAQRSGFAIVIDKNADTMLHDKIEARLAKKSEYREHDSGCGRWAGDGKVTDPFWAGPEGDEDGNT